MKKDNNLLFYVLLCCSLLLTSCAHKSGRHKARERISRITTESQPKESVVEESDSADMFNESADSLNDAYES